MLLETLNMALGYKLSIHSLPHESAKAPRQRKRRQFLFFFFDVRIPASFLYLLGSLFLPRKCSCRKMARVETLVLQRLSGACRPTKFSSGRSFKGRQSLARRRSWSLPFNPQKKSQRTSLSTPLVPFFSPPPLCASK